MKRQTRGKSSCATGCVLLVLAGFFAAGAAVAGTDRADGAREISRDELLDRIRGGWTGMLIGGLEGLPHEFQYNDAPRADLPDFTFLEGGARSDDDNDFEWTHLWFMDRERTIFLPYPRLVGIWKANMNQGIWVANERARKLMDEGVLPPDTSDPARNPFATYNLSGQFCVETYGMIAPGLPQTAGRIGRHYARIAVSGEPLQATQFWTGLISLLPFTGDPIEDVMARAAEGLDPDSAMAGVVADARALHQANPQDWKAARQALHRKWVVEKKWNGNSTPVNGGMVALALLYGNEDFYRTLQLAMAMGHDADCNAATAGAVLGYRMGFRRLATLPQYKMPDRYINKTRPELPAEIPVSEQAETILRVSERVLLAQGAEPIVTDGRPGFRIVLQPVSAPAP